MKSCFIIQVLFKVYLDPTEGTK